MREDLGDAFLFFVLLLFFSFGLRIWASPFLVSLFFVCLVVFVAGSLTWFVFWMGEDVM